MGQEKCEKIQKYSKKLKIPSFQSFWQNVFPIEATVKYRAITIIPPKKEDFGKFRLETNPLIFSTMGY